MFVLPHIVRLIAAPESITIAQTSLLHIWLAASGAVHAYPAEEEGGRRGRGGGT